jgi:uncharacterized membrane protein YuzA (DUF378 family)
VTEPANTQASSDPQAAPAWLLDRIGVALSCPAQAMRLADAPGASGRAASDAVALLALVFVATSLRDLVSAGWMVADGALPVALHSVVSSLAGLAAGPLAFLFAGGLLVTVLAGRRRSIGRDFDLASVALVPALSGVLLVELVRRLLGAGAAAQLDRIAVPLVYGIAALWLVVAVRVARRRGEGGAP